MDKIEKTKFEFLKNCLLINNEVLVFSDFHLGYEDRLVNKGMLLNIQFKETMKNLDMIFRGLFLNGKIVKKIIILGDLKHDFGVVGEAEWREAHKLLDYLIKKVGQKNLILIKGNHDNYLIGVAKKKRIGLEKYFVYKDILFIHGHQKYKKIMQSDKIKYLVMGHIHPAITFKDEYKREKYKCFLIGKLDKKTVYVLPSFTNISYGYDLVKLNGDVGNRKNKEKFGIIEAKKLRNFEIIIYNDKDKKQYDFGKVRKLID